MPEKKPQVVAVPLLTLRWRSTALVVVAALTQSACGSREPKPPTPVEPAPIARHVVLVSIDTLRADHLSLYGYPRPTSPQLEKLAKDAAVFTAAMSPAPYTLPSHMSMMTGMHPWAHGVRFGNHYLRESFVTLAETMHDGGYKTAAFTDGGLVATTYGFGQGFDSYNEDRQEPSWSSLVNGFRRYSGQLHDWIRWNAEDPFFLFVHSFDTHGPYMAEQKFKDALAPTRPVVPEGAKAIADPIAFIRSLNCHEYLQLDRYQSLEQIIDDYDATVRFVDERIGRLVDLLVREKIYDDTLLIITSDHGESFLDRGVQVGHGLTLYEEDVHVPLIIKFPRGQFAGVRCDEVVRLIDLFPTVCAATRQAIPTDVQGADIVDALTGKDAEPRIAVGESPNLAGSPILGFEGFSSYARRRELKYLDAAGISFEDMMRIHLHRPKDAADAYDCVGDPLSIRPRIPRTAQLFDLDADPQETRNIADTRADQLLRIRAALKAVHSRSTAVFAQHGSSQKVLEDMTVDELLREQNNIRDLLSLGYISAQESNARTLAVKRLIEQKKR